MPLECKYNELNTDYYSQHTGLDFSQPSPQLQN